MIMLVGSTAAVAIAGCTAVAVLRAGPVQAVEPGQKKKKGSVLALVDAGAPWSQLMTQQGPPVQDNEVRLRPREQQQARASAPRRGAHLPPRRLSIQQAESPLHVAQVLRRQAHVEVYTLPPGVSPVAAGQDLEALKRVASNLRGVFGSRIEGRTGVVGVVRKDPVTDKFQAIVDDSSDQTEQVLSDALASSDADIWLLIELGPGHYGAAFVDTDSRTLHVADPINPGREDKEWQSVLHNCRDLPTELRSLHQFRLFMHRQFKQPQGSAPTSGIWAVWVITALAGNYHNVRVAPQQSLRPAITTTLVQQFWNELVQLPSQTQKKNAAAAGGKA